MNPVLRQLALATTASEIADLLEKHVGDSCNNAHCKEAYDALVQKVKSEDARRFAAFVRAVDGSEDWCSQLRIVIHALRAGFLTQGDES